jgi:hypothetical protein
VTDEPVILFTARFDADRPERLTQWLVPADRAGAIVRDWLANGKVVPTERWLPAASGQFTQGARWEASCYMLDVVCVAAPGFEVARSTTVDEVTASQDGFWRAFLAAAHATELP